MVSIELQNIQLFAFHGIAEEEEHVGSPYEVNLAIHYEEEANSDFNSLSATINYVDLFDIVKQRMMIATPLLEKVCEGIIRRVKHQFSKIKAVEISIYKLQAPIENFQGKVGVSMKKTYD